MRCWIAPWSFVGVIGYYTACLALPKIRASMLARCWFGIGIAAFVATHLFPTRNKEPWRDFTVTWINTGRTLSTLIETPSARFLFLPDRAAVDSNVERILLPYIATERKWPISSMITENSEFGESLIGKELLRTCSISTITICSTPVMWMESQGQRVLFVSVFTTRVQRYLVRYLKKRPDVIATHIPPNWHWDEEFVARFKPALLVETGSPRNDAGENSPWPNVRTVTPQKLGFYTWTASGGVSGAF